MPLATAEPAAGLDWVVDPIGIALEQVAQRLGATCLLESRDGRVIGHVLTGQAPPPVAEAVLGRSVAPLQAGGRRRTVALVPGGPLTTVTLTGGGGPAWVVPVVSGSATLGWLWVLTARTAAQEPAVLVGAAADVAKALSHVMAPDDRELLDALQTGTGSFAALLGPQVDRLWVAAIRSAEAISPRAVAGSLRVALPAADLPMAVAVGVDAAYLVAGTSGKVAVSVVQQAVEVVLSRSTDGALAAVVSDAAASPAALPRARAQADAALPASEPGRCLSLAEVRPRVVLQHLCAAVANLPDLGPDPLQALLAYDQKRRSDFAGTLLTWLDCNGDVSVAAEILGMHPNTMRYRLARAQQVLDVDLENLATRVEVHLRLRAHRADPAFRTYGESPSRATDPGRHRQR